jgi:hypothetical protein
MLGFDRDADSRRVNVEQHEKESDQPFSKAGTHRRVAYACVERYARHTHASRTVTHERAHSTITKLHLAEAGCNSITRSAVN